MQESEFPSIGGELLDQLAAVVELWSLVTSLPDLELAAETVQLVGEWPENLLVGEAGRAADGL